MKLLRFLFGVVLFVSFVLFPSSSSLFSSQNDDDEDDDENGGGKSFNFASQAAGAIVLDKSPPTAKGYSHLLNDDMDKYGISPCDEKKWVVIGLSEDILVTTVALSNYEKYSSMLREFQVLASTAYPTEKWINLGLYTAEPRLGEQTFNISDSPAHTRYLKFKFLSHYGSEDLCTLSQIKVHGTTVIASFKQEVERSDSHIRDLLSHLNGEVVLSGGNEIPDDSLHRLPSSSQVNLEQEHLASSDSVIGSSSENHGSSELHVQEDYDNRTDSSNDRQHIIPGQGQGQGQ